MELLLTILVIVYGLIGMIWLLERITWAFDKETIKEVLFVDYFVKGNIIGKVLCIIAIILLLPWICMYFIMNILSILKPYVKNWLFKVSGFSK